MAALRTRRGEAGMRRTEVWVYAQDVAQIKRLVERLCRRRERQALAEQLSDSN